MTTAQQRLDTIRTYRANWNTYGAPQPEPQSIDYAETWIAMFQQECGDTWIEPTFVNPVPWTVLAHEVCFEWYHGMRHLSLYVGKKEAVGLQIWDNHNPQGRMDDCEANTPEERAALWAWLTEENQA